MLPQKQSKFTTTVQVDRELYDSVKKQTEKRGISFRQAVEHGLREFLKQAYETEGKELKKSISK